MSIRCLSFWTSILLHQAESLFLVSNWYRHVKICIKSQGDSKHVQSGMHNILPGNPSNHNAIRQ